LSKSGRLGEREKRILKTETQINKLIEQIYKIGSENQDLFLTVDKKHKFGYDNKRSASMVGANPTETSFDKASYREFMADDNQEVV